MMPPQRGKAFRVEGAIFVSNLVRLGVAEMRDGQIVEIQGSCKLLPKDSSRKSATPGIAQPEPATEPSSNRYEYRRNSIFSTVEHTFCVSFSDANDHYFLSDIPDQRGFVSRHDGLSWIDFVEPTTD